ncbi:hypothetical protein W02_42910 [Nitrospira sp. KM1]|uniref:hypothetical protein n=1 Tax=Nitrospira sp. KM1 TaxID=1936990 RepID=UPI0013A7A06A|nr:hypothetical protein [Nitrospira sp. KM1]BCA57151.1 hypothetical protein W02_42910 [Nitrospira sp. KM1]
MSSQRTQLQAESNVAQLAPMRRMAPAAGAAAGPPAAPNLDKKTFLVDHTSSHRNNIPQGHAWSIKINDFGRQ